MPVILPEEARPKALVDEKIKKTATPKPKLPTPRRGVRLGAPPAHVAEPPVAAKVVLPKSSERASRKPKVKNDPEHVAAARELRDRYLEQFNAGKVLPAGKYAVGRELAAGLTQAPPLRLPAA